MALFVAGFYAGAGAIAAYFLQNYCPTDVQLQDNFEVQKYLGTWYEMERSKNNEFQSG